MLRSRRPTGYGRRGRWFGRRSFGLLAALFLLRIFLLLAFLLFLISLLLLFPCVFPSVSFNQNESTSLLTFVSPPTLP